LLLTKKNWELAVYFVPPNVRRDPKTRSHSIRVIDLIREIDLTITEYFLNGRTLFHRF